LEIAKPKSSSKTSEYSIDGKWDKSISC